MDDEFENAYESFTKNFKHTIATEFLYEIESCVIQFNNKSYTIDNNEKYLGHYRFTMFPAFYSEKNPVSYEIHIDDRFSVIFELNFTYIEFMEIFYIKCTDIKEAFVLACDKLLEIIITILQEVFNDE